MSALNWATSLLGCKIVDVSSEVCPAANVLDPHLPSIWLTDTGLPQWLCISLADITMRKDVVIRTIGWHCWQQYSTNPMSVTVHVSSDGAKFKLWDAFLASQEKGDQLFCCAPISSAIYPYIAFEVTQTFGGLQTYMNRILLYSDEISSSPPAPQAKQALGGRSDDSCDPDLGDRLHIRMPGMRRARSYILQISLRKSRSNLLQPHPRTNTKTLSPLSHHNLAAGLGEFADERYAPFQSSPEPQKLAERLDAVFAFVDSEVVVSDVDSDFSSESLEQTPELPGLNLRPQSQKQNQAPGRGDSAAVDDDNKATTTVSAKSDSEVLQRLGDLEDKIGKLLREFQSLKVPSPTPQRTTARDTASSPLVLRTTSDSSQQSSFCQQARARHVEAEADVEPEVKPFKSMMKFSSKNQIRVKEESENVKAKPSVTEKSVLNVSSEKSELEEAVINVQKIVKKALESMKAKQTVGACKTIPQLQSISHYYPQPLNRSDATCLQTRGGAHAGLLFDRKWVPHFRSLEK